MRNRTKLMLAAALVATPLAVMGQRATAGSRAATDHADVHEAAAATPASSTAGIAPSPSAVAELLVTADDFTFDAPAEVPAGRTAVRLVNHGREVHHVQLVRLDAGKTMDDLLAAVAGGGPPPAWAHDVGGPNAAKPGGGEFTAVVNLQPGAYALLCLVPSPDGTLHVAKGMSRALTVTAATAESTGETTSAVAGSADDDIVLTLTDYAFGFSRPLTPGTHDIRVRTVGGQSHELVVFKLEEGRTAHDVVAWFEHGQEGPPPAMPVGGVVGIAPGEEENEIQLTLERGRYALICFLPDSGDGKPHFVHGMIQDYEVR